jgi:hypothetical protein
MATLEEMFPSRFLKAADLGGKSRVVEIVEQCHYASRTK